MGVVAEAVDKVLGALVQHGVVRDLHVQSLSCCGVGNSPSAAGKPPAGTCNALPKSRCRSRDSAGYLCRRRLKVMLLLQETVLVNAGS